MPVEQQAAVLPAVPRRPERALDVMAAVSAGSLASAGSLPLPPPPRVRQRQALARPAPASAHPPSAHLEAAFAPAVGLSGSVRHSTFAPVVDTLPTRAAAAAHDAVLAPGSLSQWHACSHRDLNSLPMDQRAAMCHRSPVTRAQARELLSPRMRGYLGSRHSAVEAQAEGGAFVGAAISADLHGHGQQPGNMHECLKTGESGASCGVPWGKGVCPSMETPWERGIYSDVTRSPNTRQGGKDRDLHEGKCELMPHQVGGDTKRVAVGASGGGRWLGLSCATIGKMRCVLRATPA
jgi:hypothetical protein